MPDEKGSAASKRTRAVVDRIEDGGLAVLHVGEDEATEVVVPASLLPEGAGGGSHLLVTVSLDEGAREAAADRVKSLQEKLEKRGGGDGGRKNFKL